MRDRYFYLIFAVVIILWGVALIAGPKRVVDEPVFLWPGIIIIGALIFAFAGYLTTFRLCHRWTAAGASGTLWNPEPHLSIKLANFPNSPGLREFNLYKLNGNHYILSEGGGKDGGYAVVPADLDWIYPGSRCQRVWNVAYRWFRENPDPSRGELDLKYLPGPIYNALKGIEGWHPKAPVLFGYLPYYNFGALVKNRNLQDFLNFQNKRLTEQAEANERMLTAVSQYAEIAKEIADSYAPLKREPSERKPFIKLPKYREEEP